MKIVKKSDGQNANNMNLFHSAHKTFTVELVIAFIEGGERY